METLANETSSADVQMVQHDELLTVHEVARRLRVDDTTVRRWINNGILEAITLPHSGKRRGYRVKQFVIFAYQECFMEHYMSLYEAFLL